MDEGKTKVFNIALLRIAFTLVMTAFQTMANIQGTVLKSATNSSSHGYVHGFSGDGYISLAIIYSVCSASAWLAPPAVALLKPRKTLIIFGCAYAIYIGQFLHPNTILLYATSAILGLSSAFFWIAQGHFLTQNSDVRTFERNSGIFWAMIQCSLVIGNTFVFVTFFDVTDIDAKTRTTISSALLAVCILGLFLLVFLKSIPWEAAESGNERQTSRDAVLAAIKLLQQPRMICLSLVFCYVGLILAFWSGVYGSCIGFTNKFGKKAKMLVGLHGILVGVGEVVGGVTAGVLGRLLARYGRDPIVVLGFVLHIAAFGIVFLNLPADAPFGNTDALGHIRSNPTLAVTTSFLLGFGDACFNTQSYAILGRLFEKESAAAFTIYNFFKTAFAGVGFFYSSYLLLTYQLAILVTFCTAATVLFCFVEHRYRGSKIPTTG